MSISTRASLGVANRGIKDSKTNRRTGNANNNLQQSMVQEPMLMEPIPTKPSGSGRFPSLKKIPTASRNAAVNNVAPKQGKVRVPPALSAYQPKLPSSGGISRPQTPSHLSHSTPVPTTPGRARPVPRQPPVQVEPEYEDENGDAYEGSGDQYDDERTEDFTFGSQVSAKPLPAPRRIDAAVRMQQNNTSIRRPAAMDRSTTRPIARPIPSQPNTLASREEENVIVYKVSSSIEPRKKTVLDALCKYIGELDEMTVLTIAKLVNDFLKRNSQQQSRNVTGTKGQSDDSGDSQQNDDAYYDQNIDERPIDDEHDAEENVFEDE
uniref:Uncharacterized protein n=1 Tax=Clandestinovirus TaxID=2831644 RepID=A0A8F8PK38_9VIRU|nr:hypothetical protein KOM_12_339 [Clandestinovirus]